MKIISIKLIATLTLLMTFSLSAYAGPDYGIRDFGRNSPQAVSEYVNKFPVSKYHHIYAIKASPVSSVKEKTVSRKAINIHSRYRKRS